MRLLSLALCCGVLSWSQLAFAQAAPPSHETKTATPAAQASFLALKSLAGAWTGTVTTDPSNPDIDGPIQAMLRVGSAGTVLVHEIAPGGVPEPTMIYVDGDRLTLVHYCEAGNRPRLVARAPADPKVVDFEFVDLSGSEEPTYLQRLVFTVIAGGHHTEDWTFRMPGGKTLRAHWDLKRTAKP